MNKIPEGLFYHRLAKGIRWGAILLSVLIVLTLIQKDLILSGEFSVGHDYQNPSPFFTELVPKQRIITTEEGSEFIDEPIYTTFRYPRPFQTVAVDVEFTNPNNLFVEFGPLSGIPEQYELKGLNHPQLNQLLENNRWNHAQGDLYQLTSADYQYLSSDQFWTGLPEKQITGYYNLDWLQPYLPDFSEANPKTIVEHPLRGGHTFLIASDQENLDLKFEIYDLNNSLGADPISLEVLTWGGELLRRMELNDDGKETDTGGISEKREVSLSTSLPEPSVYQVVVNASSDIILNRIEVNAEYLVLKNRIQLAGGPEYRSHLGDAQLGSVNLQLSARKWNIQTTHRSTLQTVRMVHESVELTEPYKFYEYTLPVSRRFILDDGYTLISPEGNITLQGRGVIALSPETFFSPYPWLIDSSTDPEVLGLNYLLTGYEPPVEMDSGVYTQSYEFDLAKVYAPDKALRFQFSLPEMQDQKEFHLKSVHADYRSDPITFSNAKEKLLRFIEREF